MAAMGHTAKLTVCIPCFNEERYIGEAIESVFRQDYRDFVILVVDDGSTDGTLKALKRYADPRVAIHRNRENLGLYQNLNRCLALSNTPYIKILCADDVLAPKCLEEQVAVLERFPGVSLVFGSSEVVDSVGRRLVTRRFSNRSQRIQGRRLVRTILSSARNPIGEPSGTMFRRSVIEARRSHFRVEKFQHMADLDFWIQLLEHGDGYSIDKTLFSFRIHKSAGTTKLLKRSISEHQLLQAEYAERHPMNRFESLFVQAKSVGYFLGKLAFIRLFAR